MIELRILTPDDWPLWRALRHAALDSSTQFAVAQALINNIKAQGFKSIRIPVTWSNHHGAAPSYAIDQAWLNRVREVVDWALAGPIPWANADCRRANDECHDCAKVGLLLHQPGDVVCKLVGRHYIQSSKLLAA